MSKQDKAGRWRNEAPPRGKMWLEIERRGAASKWVTLDACAVLKAIYG